MTATSFDGTVEIEKLVYGGEGLARVDGQVMLVPYVLPGEKVRVGGERVNSGLMRGSLLSVLESSTQRVTPRCEYFASCGGCHYQHSDYAFQLQQKSNILRETLLRLGGIRYEGEIPIISGEPWMYRNRIQLHFAGSEAGFHKAGSRDLCDIHHCEISSPMLNQVILKLQDAVKQPEWPQFMRSLELFTNEEQVQFNIVDSARPVAARFFEWCSSFIPFLAKGPIEYAAAARVFRISRGSFFQVNRFLIDSLVAEVLREARGNYAVDLYAGVGLFSLALSGRFQRVEAVERSRPAFRDLEWNIGQSGRAIQGSAEEFLRNLSEAPDWIVADPPRAGLGREATDELHRIRPRRLTLVSCDPATLTRDLKRLGGEYGIERLTLIDLFPQTYHFEVVAHLAKS